MRNNLNPTGILAASPSEATFQQPDNLGYPSLSRLKSAKHGQRKGSVGKASRLRELTASDNTLQLCNIYLDHGSTG